MPPRSRTKPGSTTRRPKVAGLRPHAHAGPATRHPDVDPDALDIVEVPDALDAPAVDDRDATTEAPPAATRPAPEMPADTADDTSSSDGARGSTVDDAAADTTVLPTPAHAPGTPTDAAAADGATVTSTDAPDTPAAPAPDTPDSPAEPAVDTATDTATDPASDTATGTAGDDTATGTADDPATDTSTDTATDTDAPTAATPAATTPTRSRRGRGRSGMAPRAEAAATPTRERSTRRGSTDTADTDADTATAAPIRTAKPTRTGGRRTTDPEAAPRTGRLAGARAALTRFGRSRALPIVLAPCVVVCLVLSGLAFWQGRQAWTSGPMSNAAVVDVSGTAELVGQTRESIEKIFSYDYTRLDDSVEAARTMSTGQFTDRYLSVFDQTIRDPAMQQQLRQTATAVNTGVISIRGDRAEVMVLAQFSAQRTSTGQSTNAPGLLRAEMLRVDGRWKLAELNPLTANR